MRGAFGAARRLGVSPLLSGLVIVGFGTSAPELVVTDSDQQHGGRLYKELKRRTRVATLFPNEGSCLRLVSAVAMEIAEEWETGRVDLTMEQ